MNWDEISHFLGERTNWVASVYSASAVARAEFPDHDVTVRGAGVHRPPFGRSAGRVGENRPKPSVWAISARCRCHRPEARARSHRRALRECCWGESQHGFRPSPHLCQRTRSSIGANIVNYRAEHGAFASRKETLESPQNLGRKAFEQCAGFLRIPQAKHPLDNTAVHPERYALVEKMASDAGTDLQSLIAHPEIRQKIDLKRYCTAEVGLPTLHDIWAELDKPGRDPRGTAQVFQFEERVHSIDDLEIGMVLPGVVTNVTNLAHLWT